MPVETIIALILSGVGILVAPVVAWLFRQVIALGKENAVLAGKVETLKSEQTLIREGIAAHNGESANFQAELRRMITDWRTEMRDGIAGLNTRIAVIESHMNGNSGKASKGGYLMFRFMAHALKRLPSCRETGGGGNGITVFAFVMLVMHPAPMDYVQKVGYIRHCVRVRRVLHNDGQGKWSRKTGAL